MANINESVAWEEGIYQLETTDPVQGGPDGVDNLPHKHLANRTAWLKEQVQGQGQELTSARGTNADLGARLQAFDGTLSQVVSAVDGLLESNDPRTAGALQLDWLYSNDRVAMEMWGSRFTMIDIAPRPVADLPSPSHPGVAGDDSLDILDTSGLIIGEWYVLFDGAKREPVQISHILDGSRIRVASPLLYTYSQPAYLARHNFDALVGGSAQAKGGDLYFTTRLNLGNNEAAGGMWIRRTDNDTVVKVFYKSTLDGAWAQSAEIAQRRDSTVPGGKVDVQYKIPFNEYVWVKVQVQAGSNSNNVELTHFVAYGSRDDIDKYFPTVVGAANLPRSSSGSYTITNYDSRQTYVLETIGAGSVTRSGDTIGYTTPATEGAGGFKVNGRAFAVQVAGSNVVTPLPTAPVQAAVNIGAATTLTASAFQFVGSAITHTSSDWQVATDAGFMDIFAQVASDTTNKNSYALAGLQPNTSYFWRVRYRGSSGDVSSWSVVRSFSTKVAFAGVQAPTLTSPAAGEGGQLANVTMAASAFQWLDSSTTHASSDWQLSTDSSFINIVRQANADATNKTSWSVTGLSVNSTYYWRVRYRGANAVVSEWSAPRSFATKTAFVPTVPGEPYGGGYYAGKIVVGGQTYALIVAPKAQGESAGKAWKPDNTATPGTQSFNDGLSNSNAMNNASHPAAQFCRSLAIGGNTDWYLPSLHELELCYRAFKPGSDANYTADNRPDWRSAGYNVPPENGNGHNAASSPVGAAYTPSNPAQTGITQFQSGGSEAFVSSYYWTSTEFLATFAWVQLFSNGHQTLYDKLNSFPVRAVRKVLI